MRRIFNVSLPLSFSMPVHTTSKVFLQLKNSHAIHAPSLSLYPHLHGLLLHHQYWLLNLQLLAIEGLL